ncbi:2OG-Fe(II) oxygenase [Bacteriovorax sp. Seq25_V]|uniref:2OG-Fe(II) oxygenase n=1 Tax=Bacteriovorax sp. Seq25_V TaxID=1201288 RepID=UPI00038A0250|nr:2OG-Fe(II) oxygenase [Bacteriovorax sp. Seq25_V]EQC44009.1 oxidoreductase, 2OG-Fe(II) oxygenase family protein [Bacteriovorax sp. Seq25_V]
MNISNINFQQMNQDLETKGWFCGEKILSDQSCETLTKLLKAKYDADNFIEGGVSKGLDLSIENRIRKSLVSWIEDWNENDELKQINIFFNDLMINLNEYFFLSMKRFESQFAIYEEGGFYKKHLDQHKQSPHRQMSCIFYLNDCLDGGELVVFNEKNRNEVDYVVKPKRGTFVLFISKTIFHEVLETRSPRFSLTTWFRDDEIIPFV